MEKSLEYTRLKNILIIAYRFPPMGGIGTRRCAKYAKYLAKLGYKVHVITIQYDRVDAMNWLYDIEDNNNIIVHRVKSGYPLWLMYTSKNKYINFIQKALNLVLKRTFFYMDIAQNWGKYMLPKAKEIIAENNIDNVIVTNPPPSVSYISTYLKIELPQINLIQDFRDSWNDDIDYVFPGTLKFFWQKEKSAYMEWFVVNHSDYIVNVTEDITKRTKNKFKQYSNKFLTIYNGFDKDDIANLVSISKESNKIRIIYAGGLGLGRIKALELIMDILLDMPLSELEKLEINIYTSFDTQKLDEKYNRLLGSIIKFRKLVAPSQIFKEIALHDYALSINSPMYPYAFGTKIFDYMMLNKKIIHISNEGELSQVLRDSKQLVANYEKDNIRKIFNITMLNQKRSDDGMYHQFDIENLIKEYEKLFI